MKNFSSLIKTAILAAAFILFSGWEPATGEQQAKIETKRVLVLYSYHEGLPWEKLIDDSFRDILAAKSTFPIEINVEHTDQVHYANAAYRNQLVDLYQHKYSHPGMDLVIGIDDEAADLLLKFGKKLFPDVPIVLITAKSKYFESDRLEPNMTSLLWELDIRANIELISDLMPQTRHIFVVAGTSQSDREVLEAVQAYLREETKRLEIHYLTDVSASELLKKVSMVPKHSAILYLAFSRDAEGKSFVPREILSMVSSQASVPVFGIVDTYLGYGIAGGNLLSAEMQGKRCGELALSILRGEPQGNSIPNETLGQLLFDWRQLKRWGISETRLPPDSIVRFKTYSFWEQYRWGVIFVIALILAQSWLITFLIRQRTLHRRAKAKLTARLSFEEMLSGLSARFVNLPPKKVDEEIERVLESIGRRLCIDRVSVLKILHADQKLQRIHSHENVAVTQLPSEVQFKQVPWIINKITSNELVVFSDIEDMPAEAEKEKSFTQSQGTVSLLLIPLSTMDKTIGILALAMVKHRKAWSQELIRQCRLIAEIFTNALLRKEHEGSLAQAENKYRTVADFTYDWEYWVNLDGSIEYVSPSCERITGYTARDFIENPSLFSEIVVPEDRDIWTRHFHDSHQSLMPQEIQFRIQRHGGDIRWIEHNCQAVTDHNGRLQGFRASNRDITTRKRVEQEILEREKDLRKLASQLISAHEEERRSLARELHDDLSQRLAAMAIYASRMEQQSADKHALDAEACSMLRDQIIDISNDVHNLSRQLHPSILDDLGLTRAVKSQCVRFSDREGVEVAFTTENVPATLSKNVSLSIYRIIQEGLNNIAKHACASNVKVDLHCINGSLCLSVQDDGIGFDTAEVRRKPGLGLSSMRERVRIIHGELRVTSEPEEGTTISVRVPMEHPGRDESITNRPGIKMHPQSRWI